MKGTIILVVVSAIITGGAIIQERSKKQTQTQPPVQQVIGKTTNDGSQVVEIIAKGGYSPRVISAQAGVPTTIKVTTNSTFDCSAALTIPSIAYRTNLPPSGVTEIQVPPQAAGTSLKGICQMGMYNFAINFN